MILNEEFLNICIKADTPVRDAMKIIESESAQIVLVVDERKKLLELLLMEIFEEDY